MNKKVTINLKEAVSASRNANYAFKIAKNDPHLTKEIILKLSNQRKIANKKVKSIRKQEKAANRTNHYNDIMSTHETANDKQFSKLIKENRSNI